MSNYEDVGMCHFYPTFKLSQFHIGKEQASKGPVITKFTVPNEPDGVLVYFMIHTKNPRLISRNGTRNKIKAKGVLLLLDQNYDLIDGKSDDYHFFGIEGKKLRGGNYYLISDANYRQFGQKHSYNVSTYSKTVIDLSYADSDINEALKICLSEKGLSSEGANNIFPKVYEAFLYKGGKIVNENKI